MCKYAVRFFKNFTTVAFTAVPMKVSEIFVTRSVKIKPRKKKYYKKQREK